MKCGPTCNTPNGPPGGPGPQVGHPWCKLHCEGSRRGGTGLEQSDSHWPSRMPLQFAGSLAAQSTAKEDWRSSTRASLHSIRSTYLWSKAQQPSAACFKSYSVEQWLDQKVTSMKERRSCQKLSLKAGMDPTQQSIKCKIVVVGDSQCGKTALLHVFAKDCFPEVSLCWAAVAVIKHIYSMTTTTSS